MNAELRKIALVLTLLSMSSLSCAPRTDRHVTHFPAEEHEHVLGIVLDLSGSFQEKLQADDGAAFHFFQALVDKYFRDRMGDHDRLVLAQLSCEGHSLLWDGSPRTLMSKFSSPADFRNFLISKSDPHCSKVYHSISRMLWYVSTMPGVVEGKTKPCVIVLSDMYDNSPDSKAEREQLEHDLAQFGKCNGASIGLYWVAVDMLPQWRSILPQSGIGHWVVASDIDQEPQLPSFDE